MSTAREPTTLDVSKAAAYLLVCHRDANPAPGDREPGQPTESAYYAALDMWEALTGLTADDALAYAHDVATTRQRAALIPF